MSSRKSLSHLPLLAVLVLSGSVGSLLAADDAEPVVQDFTLADFRGREHALSDYADKQLIAVVFLGTECPLAKLYAPELVTLSESYAKQGLQVVAIDSNSQDSLTEIAAYATRHGLTFPVLKDTGNRIADRFGAERTPEVFLLDQDRRVRYRGRIDDRYGVGYIRDEATRKDLEIAIEEVLSGKAVSKPQTKPIGCLIGRVRKPKSGSEVTFSDDIVPILEKRCVECHREGEIAPFALLDYHEVAGWAEMIDEVVQEERMPPWHASAAHGNFANDRRMTDAEKKTIREWVRNGAPEGTAGRTPKLPPRSEGWQLSQKPDLVIPMRDKPFTVPAEGVVKYQYFRVKPDFKEDRWVKAAEIIPGNRRVVHHVLVLVRDSRGRVGSVFRSGFLTAYVPGLRAVSLPEGMAKRIPAGAELIFQVHYTPIGTEQQDLSKLGLVFADPKEIEHAVVTTAASSRRLNIPPHASNHRVEATSRSVDSEVQLLGMAPHMHLRGKSFSYEAVYPDGTREMLLDVPAYDFNWQTSYRLQNPKTLPKGTRLHCVAHFDNSEENLANPNPNDRVRWGDQTWNEMMLGYFDIAIPIKTADAIVKKANAPDADPAEQRAEGIIDEYDSSGNGKLERKEVPERLQKFFLLLDTNRDDAVDLEEMTRGVRFMMKRQR